MFETIMFCGDTMQRNDPKTFPVCVQVYERLFHRRFLTLLIDGLDSRSWSDYDKKGCRLW